MMPEYTVKEYASRERVTPRTVRRWIEKGAVAFRHTAGGGVRIIDPPSSSRVVFLNMSNDDKLGQSSK
jgi:excisionase family DNA binding protein